MNARLRRLVRDRAGGRCEYCRIHDDDDAFGEFHVEHVRARKHGGGDDPDNLAWACHVCNLFKGPNLSGVDPRDGRVVLLYHPRRRRWSRHFRAASGVLRGPTRTGRTTVSVLNLNDPTRVETRRIPAVAGRWPG